MLAAAQRTLNPPGEGSSPSGPTDRHWSSSGEDTAPVMRRRGSESLPVLLYGSLTIRHTLRAHDVAAACRLAMAEVRVQLPLGAFTEQDVGKPGIPRASGARDRRFKSGRPDCNAVGPVLVRAGAC